MCPFELTVIKLEGVIISGHHRITGDLQLKEGGIKIFSFLKDFERKFKDFIIR